MYGNISHIGSEILNKGMQKWCKASGKGFSVETLRPVLKNTELKGLKYAPKLEGDVLQLSKTTKQIFEEFKPVSTIKEASKRAVDEYGLKAFDIKDVDVANDALYVLHKIKYKSLGQLGITEIREVSTLGDVGLSTVAAEINPENGVMRISRRGLIKTASFRIVNMVMQVPMSKLLEYENLLIKMINGKIPMYQLTKDMEKLGLKAHSLNELPFQTFVHELGHRAHFLAIANKELFCKMAKLEEMKNWGITDFSIFEEFMSKETQDIIKSWPFLGNYARTSPLEFVADVYSALIHDVKVPDNIMKLYEKYYGPKVL